MLPPDPAAQPPQRQTFRPHERLRLSTEFQKVYAFRRSVSDRELSLIVYGMPNGLPYNRIGLSVARRVLPRAYQRNRMKRLLREAYRLRRAELPTGMDLIFVPRGKRVPSLATLQPALVRLIHQLARRLDKERGSAAS